MIKKSLGILAALVFATTLLIGCSSGTTSSQSQSKPAQEEKKAEPLNLDGTWKTTNNTSSDSWQEAVINGDTITIQWISENGDTKSLYWVGSVVEPTDKTVEDTYTWESINDKDQTDRALMSSGADSKTFTYSNGELSYELSIMGTTKTMRMERI